MRYFKPRTSVKQAKYSILLIGLHCHCFGPCNKWIEVTGQGEMHRMEPFWMYCHWSLQRCVVTCKDGHFYCKIVLIICSIDCIHFAHHHFLINPIVKHWGASPFSSHLKEWVTRALCKISKDCHHFEKPCGSSAFLAFIMRTGANAEILPLYVQLFRPLKKKNRTIFPLMFFGDALLYCLPILELRCNLEMLKSPSILP